MGKWAAVASSVLFLIVVASAEAQSGNAYFGYSYYNSTNLSSPLFGRASTNGWEASVEAKVSPFVGFVAQFDGLFGAQNVSNCGQGCGPFRSATSQYNYLFGPRASVSLAKIRPFGEVLFGGSHMNVHISPPRLHRSQSLRAAASITRSCISSPGEFRVTMSTRISSMLGRITYAYRPE